MVSEKIRASMPDGFTACSPESIVRNNPPPTPAKAVKALGNIEPRKTSAHNKKESSPIHYSKL
jgi:hypothetical protein